jgi:hypothetical protein
MLGKSGDIKKRCPLRGASARSISLLKIITLDDVKALLHPRIRGKPQPRGSGF